MSNTAGESGALNAFGDLSRRARRELEENGLNPDVARDELLSTGAITLPSGGIFSSDLVNPATGGFSSPVGTDTGQHSTAGLSRRELRAMQERTEVLPGVTSTTGAAVIPAPTGSVMPTFTLPTMPGAPGSGSGTAAGAVAGASNFGISPALSDTATPVEHVISETTTPLDQMLNQRAVNQQAIAQQAVSEPSVTSQPSDTFSLSTQSTGVISTTSHALIIPSPPDPLSGPILTLDQTGEILMTGQIVLPASMGTTGADAGRLDMPDVDIVDYGSEVIPSQDLAPVRATSAVSATVTRGGAVTSPIKSRDRVPLALTITATILAVTVVGLFVTGYLLGVF